MFEPVFNPEHPATKRLNELYERAKRRVEELEASLKKKHTEKKEEALSKARITLMKRERNINSPFHYCGDVEPVDAEQTLWHIRQIHQDKNAYLQVMVIDNSFIFGERRSYVRRHGCDMPWLEKNISYLMGLGMNTYCASADFFRWNSQNRLIQGEPDKVRADSSDGSVQKIQAIIVDLDYYRTEYGGLLAEDLIETMRAEGAFEASGEPSYTMQTSTGKGAYLVYLLKEPVLILRNEKNIEEWARNTGRFISQFVKYGADPKTVNVSRVFRLPGSYHQGSESWSYILNFDQIKNKRPMRYDYKTLIASVPGGDAKTQSEEASITATEALEAPEGEEATPTPTEQEKTPEAIQKPQERKEIRITNFLNDITPVCGIETMAYNRCRDLYTLAKIRNYDINGFRNELLFIMATQLILCVKSENYQLKCLNQVNAEFLEPLPEKDIKTILLSASSKQYKFSDATIISRLSITTDELKYMQVLWNGNNDNKESDKRYQKQKARYSNGQTKTKAKKNYQLKKIQTLKRKGLTQKQISEELNISLSTVKRAYKEVS